MMNNMHASTGETRKPAAVGEKLQMVVFKLGLEEYALPIQEVKEVVTTPKIVKIPHSPDCVKGIASIRGSLVAVIDLEKKFNLNPYPDHEDTFVLVLENRHYQAGILVKEVPQTLSLFREQLNPVESILVATAMDQACIQGIACIAGRTIALLDARRILDFSGYAELNSRRN